MKFIILLLLVSTTGILQAKTPKEVFGKIKDFSEKNQIQPPKLPKCKKQPKLSDESTAKLEQLFNQFIDLNDKTLSWKEFASQASDLFGKQEGCEKVHKAFKDLSTCTNATYIGWNLRPHGDKFPKTIQTKLANLGTKGVLNLISTRVKLNKK